MLRRISLQCRGPLFDPCIRKIPWRRKWQPTPVFFPEEFYEQRSLAVSSPWGPKEANTTERLLLTQIWTGAQNNIRHLTVAQQVIVDFPRSHMINAFLGKDHPLPVEQNPGSCVWAGAARAPKISPFPGLPPPHGPGQPGQSPCGEELQLHCELWRTHAPSMQVSVLGEFS